MYIEINNLEINFSIINYLNRFNSIKLNIGHGNNGQLTIKSRSSLKFETCEFLVRNLLNQTCPASHQSMTKSIFNKLF